jgi:DNA-binding NarL/FixJ family response regulator
VVRVYVVDDQDLVREGIAALLGLQPGIEIVGSAGDGAAAVADAPAARPDVILMDVRMPEMDGVAATAALARLVPACRIVMLTTFDDEEYVTRALQAGAVGYLLKNLPASDLAAAIRLAHAGVSLLDASITSRWVTGPSGPPGPTGPDRLTQRETEVLRRIAAGASNREIASHLHLSEGTVKNHISRILQRLGLRDRTQAAIYAKDNGLL